MTILKHLNQNSLAVQYLMKKDKHLAKVIQMVGPMNYQLQTDAYAFLVSQIIEQMLSKKVAKVLTARLINECAGKICPTTIQYLSDKQLLSIGISHSKVHYIQNLTGAILTNKINFSDYLQMSDTEVIDSLTTVKGIGIWSAKMFLIFSLNRPDILPFEDVAFLQSYSWVYKTHNLNKAAVVKKCSKWHPYASIASRYMYQAKNLGLTKNIFHLYKK
jgi:DNA-3-methyladenine glycosylase II